MIGRFPYDDDAAHTILTSAQVCIVEVGEIGELEIWRSGDLEIWRSGDLVVWGFGDLGSLPNDIPKSENATDFRDCAFLNWEISQNWRPICLPFYYSPQSENPKTENLLGFGGFGFLG